MKAVVLAGGLRSGLEIAGSGLPRALWPFPGEPLISQVLRFLQKSNCEEMAICANGKTRLIASELQNAAQPWTNLHYSEDPLPRGPAGCLRDLADWLPVGEPFVAAQGTGFYDFDLEAMRREHIESGATITVGARRCPDDPNLLEPAGIYIIDPAALSLIPAVGYQDIKEQFIPRVLAAGMRVRCHTLRGQAMLIHSPGHYLSAIREAIVRSAKAELPSGYHLETDRQGNPIVRHETAQVDPAARITGPVWIDAGAVVEAGAVLAGPVVVGPNARVGNGALLHRAVLMKEAQVHANAEVFSAVLGPGNIRRPQTPRRPERTERAASRGEERGWASRNPVSRLLRAFAR